MGLNHSHLEDEGGVGRILVPGMWLGNKNGSTVPLFSPHRQNPRVGIFFFFLLTFRSVRVLFHMGHINIPTLRRAIFSSTPLILSRGAAFAPVLVSSYAFRVTSSCTWEQLRPERPSHPDTWRRIPLRFVGLPCPVPVHIHPVGRRRRPPCRVPL